MTKYSGIIVLNISTLIIIIFLQMMGYGSAPTISSDKHFKNNVDKKAACIEQTKVYNQTCIIEILIGGTVLLVSNYFLLRKNTRKHIMWTTILLILYFTSTGLTLAYFSRDYIHRNMQINW